MNAHIAKPIDIDILFSTLSQWVKPGRAPANHQQKLKVNSEPDTPGRAASFDRSEFPELDVEEALRRIMNNQSLYIDILHSFVDTQYSCAENIRHAIEEGDVQLAERLAHSVRGAAGTIGAQNIYQAADVVEQSIRHNMSIEDIKPGIAELDALIKSLSSKIKQKVPVND